VYYFDNREHEKHRVAVSFINSFENESSLFVSQQNVREFAAVLYEKKKVAVERVQHYLYIIQRQFTILEEKPSDVVQSLAWADQYAASFWDGLISSTAKRYQIATIYTEDTSDFAKIPGIKAINPLK
jgi:predicted nucleic acid-binding protein